MTGRALRLLVRFAACLLAWTLLVPAAQAQWTPSGASGQSTLTLTDPGKALALAAAARVLVVVQDDNRLAVVDPDAGSVLGHVALPYEPRSVAISSDGRRAYVVYGNSKLTAVDVATRSIIGTWTVGGDLRSLVLMPGETELAVADAGPNRLLGVSAATGAVTRQLALAHEPRELIRANGDSKLVVGAVNGWLITVDGSSFSVLSQRKLADEIRSLAWWEAGARALAVHKRADALSLVNIAANQVTGTVALDGDPDRAAVAQSSGVGYIATHDDASVNRVDLAGPALLGRYAIAARLNALVFDPAANVLYGALRNDQKLVRLDPAAASLISVLQLQKRLRDVAVNPSTHEAVAVADKSDEMFVIKLSDRSVRTIALPARPDLVAVDSALNRAVVAFRGSGPKLRFADLVSNTLFAETIAFDRNLNAIAVDATRSLALAIADGERPVLFIDTNSRTRLADGPEDRYRALAIHSGRGVAYLATEDRQLKVMDLATRAITATVDLDFKANAIAVDEALDKAVLSTGTGDKVHVLDLVTLQLTASHTLPRNPGALSLQPDTHVVVIASRESDKLSLVDLTTNALTSGFTSIEKPHALAVSGRYNQALVLSGERDEVAFIELPNPVPVLETLDPAQASAGSPAFVLSINGRGFVEASRVFFGGTQLATRWVSATRLEADVPAALLASAGSVPVTVQNPALAGGTSNALVFTVLGAPTLAAIAPPSAAADGQPKALSLTGQNFVPGATVLFGATVLSATVQSSTSIAITVPGVLTGTPGTVQVSVVNPSGLASNSLPFTLAPVLAINAVTPANAEVGATITLSGTGFDPVPAGNALVFRGINNTTVPAAALTATPSTITLRVPPLAESGPITLTNSRGTVQSPPFTVTREQDFQLVVSPAALTVYQGAANTAQAQLSSIGTKAFTGLVTLSVSGLPAGVTASFTPAATLSAFQAGAVTLTATGSAAPGNYALTVQAASSEGGTPFVRSSSLTVTLANAAGMVGIRGRFVDPDGRGVGGVIVRADATGVQTTSDAAGNFQLTGIPSGRVPLRVDATPANPLYPIYPTIVDVPASGIGQLPDWTLAPPPADEEFTPINNAAQAQVITDPRFPGFELTLPQGVRIVGHDGVVKTRVAVQRHDPDKFGVPLPPIPTRSIYQFHFGTPMGGIPEAPLPVSVPNDVGLDPGQQTEIWFYDGLPNAPSGEWRLLGMGTVSLDGKKVVANPGVGLTRFCGKCSAVCVAGGQNNPPPPPPCFPCGQGGKPVTLATGQELLNEKDLSIAGLLPITLSRTFHPFDAYNNIAGTAGSFGFGWASDYESTLLVLSSELVRIVLPGNNRVNFTRDDLGQLSAPTDPRFYGASLSNLGNNVFELKYKDGEIWKFEPFGVIHWLTERRHPDGRLVQIARRADGKMLSIQTNGGRGVTFTYGANGFVSEARDSAARTVKYTYNAQSRIETITDPENGVTRYTYVDDSEMAPPAACPNIAGGVRLKSLQRPGKTQTITQHHGPSRRVLRQTLEDGTELRFNYTVIGACVSHVSTPGVQCQGTGCPNVDSWDNFQAGWRIAGGTVVAATTIDAQGKADVQRFNQAGIANETANGQGQKTAYRRDVNNRATTVTDQLGRVTRFIYDAQGNVLRKTDPAGRIFDYTYHPTWKKVASETRYLEDGTPIVTGFEYHSSTGSLLRRIDPENNPTTYTYTAQGQVRTIANALNHVTTFEYNSAGDLVRTLDALDNETKQTPDALGRIVAVTNPLGYSTQTLYNGIDQMLEMTDAMQGVTRYQYDPQRRLQSVIDPLNHPIESYQYDDANRIVARTDAKAESNTYAYDSAGRVRTITDRNGRTTTYHYDEQGRINLVAFPDATQTRTYDAIGRLSRIDEGTSVIEYAYDTVDRVIRETQDVGGFVSRIEYQYDNLDRIVRRTVDGADPAEYAYDKAGRLTGITYRNQTTAYTWDAASRLRTKVLPNGIRQEFEYDDAGRMSSIVHKQPDDSVLEAVTYSYDAAGRRISRNSSQGNAAETAFTAQYDAANRMTSLTLTATNTSYNLSYDDNGNLTRKENTSNPLDATAYTWDMRSRLVQIDAPGTAATFGYDAFGRRTARTVNGETTRYIYDGPQAIAEVRNGETDTLLTGLRIDEVIARYSSAGPSSYLTDALNTVMAQTKNDRTVQNYYAYSPYGETTTLGPDLDNSLQYTARESDGTGLYFYRARYYDPIMKRFLQEDPVGLNGGLNIYAYANGNPVSNADPTGLLSPQDRFVLCMTMWTTGVTSWCLRPGVAIGTCGVCLLLPPPANASCTAFCLTNPISFCAAGTTVVGIAICAACVVLIP